MELSDPRRSPPFRRGVFLLTVLLKKPFDLDLVVSFFAGAGVSTLLGLATMPKRLGKTPLGMKIVFTILTWILVVLYFVLAIGPFHYWSFAFNQAGGGFLGAVVATCLVLGPVLFSAASLELNHRFDRGEAKSVALFFVFLSGGWFFGAVFPLSAIVFLIIAGNAHSRKTKPVPAYVPSEPLRKPDSDIGRMPDSDIDRKPSEDISFDVPSDDSDTRSEEVVEETTITTVDGTEVTENGYCHYRDIYGNGYTETFPGSGVVTKDDDDGE